MALPQSHGFWLIRPGCEALYWLSCLTTCIAHSVTSPKTKLARYLPRWRLDPSATPSGSAKVVQRWRLIRLIAKFCAVLVNSHDFECFDGVLCANQNWTANAHKISGN